MTLAAFWRWMNKSDEKFILMRFSAFCVEIRAPAYPSNQEHGSSGNLEHVAGYVNVFTWLRVLYKDLVAVSASRPGAVVHLCS